MFLVNGPGNAFPCSTVDLVYKLIFRGLRTLDLRHVCRFALVFAAQMLVLEYEGQHAMLTTMLRFLLFKYLALHVIATLGLSFESLFVCREDLEAEPTLEQEMLSSSESGSSGIFYVLSPQIDADRLIRRVNWQVIHLINQITLCRAKIIDELIEEKVVEPARQQAPPPKAELKQRFLRIEGLKQRRLCDGLAKVSSQQARQEVLHGYGGVSLLSAWTVGANFLASNN